MYFNENKISLCSLPQNNISISQKKSNKCFVLNVFKTNSEIGVNTSYIYFFIYLHNVKKLY